MQITLEGHDRTIPAEPGDTILVTLLRARIAFPFSCQAGQCGTCKCEVISGDILELEHAKHLLSREERASGVVLACRTQVLSDIAVRGITPDNMAASTPYTSAGPACSTSPTKALPSSG